MVGMRPTGGEGRERERARAARGPEQGGYKAIKERARERERDVRVLERGSWARAERRESVGLVGQSK